MAPRTRKPAPADVVEAVAEDASVVDDDVAAPIPEPEAYAPPAPQDGVDYVAAEPFSAQLGAQFLTFAEGVTLDPIAGAHLADLGAPVKTVKQG